MEASNFYKKAILKNYIKDYATKKSSELSGFDAHLSQKYGFDWLDEKAQSVIPKLKKITKRKR